MSRPEINEGQAARAFELSRRIEAAGLGKAVRLQQHVIEGAVGGAIVYQIVGFTVPMRDLVAPDFPAPVLQRVHAMMQDLRPGINAEQLKVHEATTPGRGYSPSQHLLNRFRAIGSCFIEHAPRCTVILGQEAQQAIFMRRTLDLVTKMQMQVRLMKSCVTGNDNWNRDGAGGAEARVSRLHTLNATLGAAVRARPEFFPAPPTMRPLRESPGDDRPQWRRLVEQYERDIALYAGWLAQVTPEIEAFASGVAARDREIQIDSQLALIASGSFLPSVGVAHLLNLQQGNALDLDGQRFDISPPLDREWRAIEATVSQAAAFHTAVPAVEEEQDNFSL